MKRSRTCQCLQELDVPKRSRSTPDLGALRRVKEVMGREVVSATIHNNGWAGALRLFRTAACGPSSATSSGEVATTSDAPLFSGGSGGPQQQQHHGQGQEFVVESIVRSQGSLNEIVILEHEQFIGDESLDFGGGSEAAILFGETVASSGSLFEDSGDSSDYFCGIDSDEADACEEEDVAYNISATLDGSNTADSHAAAHTVSTTPISGAGRTLSSLPIKACAIVCSSSGSSGDDDTEATTEWTATFSRTSTTDAIPSWCGQRRRSGYLSPAGRFGGAVSRGGGVGWTRAVCAGSDTVRNTGSRMGNPSTVISPSFAAPVPLSVPDKSCFDDDKNKRGGFNTVSAPWPTMAPSATKNQSAFDAATAAGVIAAATETSAAFIGFGSVAGIAPCGTTASAPCPAAAGLYGGGKAAPGDRSHRHHDPGGGRVGGNRGDAVVALLNVNLDRLHLESAKPSTTRVV